MEGRAPPFAAMIGISKSFGFLAPRYRGVAAMIAMAVLTAAFITVLAVLL